MTATVHRLPTIARGPRAGQPRPVTDIVLDGLTAAKEVAVTLKRNGFVVIGADIDGGQRPTVQVNWHPLIQEILNAGNAGYFRQTATERFGEFKGEGNDGTEVRIVWVEKLGGH